MKTEVFYERCKLKNIANFLVSKELKTVAVRWVILPGQIQHLTKNLE